MNNYKKIGSAAWLFCASLMITSPVQAFDCANLPQWDSTAVYVGGQEAQFGSDAYRAKWWTQNQNPITNSAQYDVWAALGSCGDDPTNQSPVADINGPYQGSTGEQISFSSAGSLDPDGSIASFSWNFGDGALSNNANPAHAYTTPGTKTITLTVTDNEGASSTASGVANISDDGDVGSCAGIQNYIAGTNYSQGDRVVSDGREFNCDIAGWCSSSSAWAYAPGIGQYWQSAWTEIGSCDVDGPNIAPVANANGAYSGRQNTAINFSSSGSSDQDGEIVSYTWSFGDGESSNVANPSHTYVNEGSFTVSLTVTDNGGLSATTSTVASISDGTGNTAPLPHRALVGYWHNFINAAGYVPIGDVIADWDIVNLSFAENKVFGAPGEVAFAPAEESEAAFIAGVKKLQGRGQKVNISLGGANAAITLNTIAERDNFVRTMGDIIARYDLDGMDIDLEGSSLIMTNGDTVQNATTPGIVNLIEATKRIKQRFGADFILTMAPETAYVQGGYATFGGIWGAYLPLIHALRNDLTVLHVQHYNTGSITAANDVTYLPATLDFHVALSDMMITGFDAGRDPNNRFPGLRSDQLAIGLPAGSGAAGSGQTSPAVVHQALDCLIKLQRCGSYRPAQVRDDFRGLMTWSVNWDKFNNRVFSAPHRAYLNSNP